MKVYFSATITTDPAIKSLYKKISNLIEKDGHSVLNYGSDSLSPTELSSRTDAEIKEAYRMLDKMLKNADLYIAEISQPSVGIGYEISQALLLRKPVLILKYQKATYEPLATLEGNKSAYLKYKTYNENSISTIIRNFLQDAKDKIDTKFILIIPPEIDKYLEWNARERGVAKAEVTREAIEQVMVADQKYQEYLKREGLA